MSEAEQYQIVWYMVKVEACGMGRKKRLGLLETE